MKWESNFTNLLTNNTVHHCHHNVAVVVCHQSHHYVILLPLLLFGFWLLSSSLYQLWSWSWSWSWSSSSSSLLLLLLLPSSCVAATLLIATVTTATVVFAAIDTSCQLPVTLSSYHHHPCRHPATSWWFYVRCYSVFWYLAYAFVKQFFCWPLLSAWFFGYLCSFG